MQVWWSTPARASLASAVVALAAGVGTHPAVAETELIDSAFSTCTTVDCSATSVAGYIGSFRGSPQPWVAKFLVLQGNCLRLQTTFAASGGPLEMVVVSPDPRIRYRNIGARLPLVKIDPAPVSGFYTVILTSTFGAAINTSFQLSFGQYNAGNPNCAGPTQRIP